MLQREQNGLHNAASFNSAGQIAKSLVLRHRVASFSISTCSRVWCAGELSQPVLSHADCCSTVDYSLLGADLADEMSERA